MEFLRPTLLYYAVLAVPLAWALVLLHALRLKMLTCLYDAVYIGKLRIRATVILQIVVVVLMVISICFAVSKPVLYSASQSQQEASKVQTENSALYIMLDVSSSMYARETSNNKTRMEQVFQFLHAYVNTEIYDSYSLIVYTDIPVLISPLSADASFVLDLLRSFTRMSKGYGTSDFMSTFKNLKENYNVFFSGAETTTDKSLIFISDGESHTEPSKYIFQTFVEQGYAITLVSVGSVGGAVVPGYSQFTSHANPRLMRRLSRYAHATYVDVASYNMKQLVESVEKSVQVRRHDIAFIGYIIAFLCMCLYITTEKL